MWLVYVICNVYDCNFYFFVCRDIDFEMMRIMNEYFILEFKIVVIVEMVVLYEDCYFLFVYVK